MVDISSIQYIEFFDIMSELLFQSGLLKSKKLRLGLPFAVS